MSSEADEASIDLFQEPADFYEPEKEDTFATHTLLNGKELTVRLVGHNPLWVRYLQYRFIVTGMSCFRHHFYLHLHCRCRYPF
jgi:hypothetical protein